MAPNRCDCGVELGGVDESEQVAALIEHAAEAHGLVLSVEFAESAVRRAPDPSAPHVTVTDGEG
jgi:hypothetical protein